MTRIRLPNNWTPRPAQLPAWAYLENGGRHAELIAHRRFGKDEIALHRTSCAAFERKASYWHMLPEYGQARKAIWAAVNPHTGKRRIDEAFPVELRSATREQEMSIVFKNGSTWQVVGSDSYNSLVGSSPAGIVYSEWALANPNARAYLRPILAENNGWQFFITTPRGRNHAYTTYKAAEKIMLAGGDAFAQILDANSTGVFTHERLETELVAYIAEFGEDYGRSKFEQEYLCSFEAANLGAILARQLGINEQKGLIGDHVQFDEFGAPLDITADIGHRDSSTWWFWQPKIGGYSVVDYDGGFGVDAEEWCHRLDDRIKKYHRAGCKTALGKIWLPHDARAKTFSAKRSAIEVFADFFGSDHVSITPNSRISDRVNAARVLTPRVEFNATNCERGLDGLRAWSYDYNEETKIFSSEPVHDWACLVAGSMIDTSRGLVAIEDIEVGALVRIPSGYRRVEKIHAYAANSVIEIRLSDGRAVTSTLNHKWFTSTGLCVADELRYDDVLFSGNETSWRMIMWIFKVCGITDTHRAIIDLSQQRSSAKMALNQGNCIAMFGHIAMEKFLSGLKYTISTTTRKTMTSQIFSALPALSTSDYMGRKVECDLRRGMPQKMGVNGILRKLCAIGKIIERNVLPMHWDRWIQHARPLKNGMEAPLGKNGTASIQKSLGKCARLTRRLALFAARNLLLIGRIEANTAGQIVGLKHLGGGRIVYDITVETDHCYIANGILSSNSHDGDGYSYGCLIMQMAAPPKQSAERMRGVTVGNNTATLEEMWKSTPRQDNRRI